MKKLEMLPFESSTNGLISKDSDKDSNHNKDSDDEHIKKESSLGSISVE